MYRLPYGRGLALAASAADGVKPGVTAFLSATWGPRHGQVSWTGVKATAWRSTGSQVI